MKKQVLMSALPSPDAPLVNILQALGDEFTELGRFADHLQTVLSPAMLRLADDPECHRNVQMLDLLSQRLTALSAFATSLARTVPPTWRIDSDEAFGVVLNGTPAVQDGLMPGSGPSEVTRMPYWLWPTSTTSPLARRWPLAKMPSASPTR
jgi:hypothetical protein